MNENTNKYLLALMIMLLLCCGATFSAEIIENQQEEIEKITVTGSRISRINIELALPVTVITAEDIANGGFNTVFDALKNLNQNMSAVEGNERGSVGSFTANADVIDLRGFGPGYTLVLLNGRRIANNPTPYNGESNFVNLNGIPLAAVERIEILSQGASAIYGSDAIAGVINVILKTNIEETTVTAMKRFTKEGGGKSTSFSLTTGTFGDDYSITASFEYYKQDPIFSRQRKRSDSFMDDPSGTSDLPRTILNYDNAEDTYRDPGDKCEQSGSGFLRVEREDWGFHCGGETIGDLSIQNSRENHSLYLNGTLDITDNIQLYTDILYTSEQSYVFGGRYEIWEDLWIKTPDGSGNDIEFEDGDRDWVYWQRTFNYNELGEETQDFKEDVYNISLGLTGHIENTSLNWEVYVTESRYDYLQTSDRLKEEKVYGLFFGEIDNEYDLYNGSGSVGLYDVITPQIRDELLGKQRVDADSYTRSLSAHLSGDLLSLDTGDISFAVTAEYTKQGYTIGVDERTLNTSGQGWYAYTDSGGGGERAHFAVGGEMLFPLFEQFELTLAARYDNYDDSTEIGGRLSPSLGATYRPWKPLLVRVNWSKGFKAPDMHYVFADESGFFNNVTDYVYCRQDVYDDDSNFIKDSPDYECEDDSISGRYKGSSDLKAEVSTNFGFGFVYEPFENLNMSIDYFDIKLVDKVVYEGEQDFVDNEYDCNFNLNNQQSDSTFCQYVYSRVNRISSGPNEGIIDYIYVEPLNSNYYRQKGIDATVYYEYQTESLGSLWTNISYTNALSTLEQEAYAVVITELRNDPASSSERVNTNVSFGWYKDDLRVSLSIYRQGSIAIWAQPDENFDEVGNLTKVSRLKPYTQADLAISYDLSEQLSLDFFAANVFNSYPAKDITMDQWPFYDPYAYGGSGRGPTYKLSASYSF